MIFSELAGLYHKVSCKQQGMYFVVNVENEGKSASISDFEGGWWYELRRDGDSAVLDKVVDTVCELMFTIREWLDR